MIVIKVPILITIMNLITIIIVIDMYLLFPINSPQAHNGVCYLRYDDTNPEKKEESFLQEFWIWSNGLVSKIVLLRKISRKSSIFSVDISLLVFLFSSLRSFNCH